MAKFFGIVFICISVIALLAQTRGEEDEDKEDQCKEKCGGRQQELQDSMDGTMVCHYDDDGPVMNPKCFVDCMGKTEADQKKCTCELCKLPDYYNGFCEEAGVETHIGKNECDKQEFCGGVGKAKYRGMFCEAKSKNHLEELKKSG